MKAYRKLFLLPLIALFITSCSIEDNNSSNADESETPLTPIPQENKNFYQLLVYSFADSNNDRIGDFKGIVNKLDYLCDLGIEGIWLSPILATNSYHAYDVKDYYTINSIYEYGDYDYKYLLEECHKRNIAVIMDLVMNHTASNHPWVSQHPKWYSGKDVFPGGMKDLNYDNTEVQNEMINVGKHWLEEGFDGYRLDAAMWLYNTGTGTGSSVNHTKNFAYWKKWCKAMREVNPDCYIIAEVLNSNHDLAYEYAKGGFNSTFDFNVRRNVYNAVNDSTYDYVEKTITDMNKAITINENYVLGRPLSNHDIGRFSQQHKGMSDEPAYYFTDFDSLRLANALNIMMRGNTFVYYGDELGLKGTCPEGYDDMAFRTPMPFKTGRTNSVTYFNGFHGNGKTTSTTLSGKSADEDSANPNSMYGVMKTLLNIKKQSNAIKCGTVAKIDGLPSGLNGYTLSDSTNTVSFIYNATSSAIEYHFSGNVLYATNSYTDIISISSKGFIVTSN